jgi:hypothetical protein
MLALLGAAAKILAVNVSPTHLPDTAHQPNTAHQPDTADLPDTARCLTRTTCLVGLPALFGLAIGRWKQLFSSIGISNVLLYYVNVDTALDGAKTLGQTTFSKTTLSIMGLIG